MIYTGRGPARAALIKLRKCLCSTPASCRKTRYIQSTCYSPFLLAWPSSSLLSSSSKFVIWSTGKKSITSNGTWPRSQQELTRSKCKLTSTSTNSGLIIITTALMATAEVAFPSATPSKLYSSESSSNTSASTSGCTRLGCLDATRTKQRSSTLL